MKNGNGEYNGGLAGMFNMLSLIFFLLERILLTQIKWKTKPVLMCTYIIIFQVSRLWGELVNGTVTELMLLRFLKTMVLLVESPPVPMN